MPRIDWKIAAALAVVATVLIKTVIDKYMGLAAVTQIATILIAAGAGYAIGWFFSPKAAKFRIIILAGALAIITFLSLGDMGVAGMGFTSIVSFVAFWAALGLWLGTAAKAFLDRPTTFGSAEWATLPYLEQHGLVGESGVRLGQFETSERSAPIHYASDRHLLTIAPTRSGKGTTAIIPNLLTYSGSVLVIDPKGENAMITAAQRERMGQDVYIVDPWNIASDGKSARFNPLDWLVNGDIDITENAMLLADALIVADGEGDKFWVEESKALLQGLILYVATDKHEEETRTLSRVRDLLLLDGDDMRLLFQRMLDSDHHIVASTGARCAQKEEKLLANVIASAQAQTHFLDSARLRESLSSSDFRFEDLKTKPMSVYLVLPADRLNTFSRWLRLMIQQAITVNARNIEVKPAKPVLFLLDEMPSLGKLTMVEQAFGLMAGFGMQLWGIAQDLGQLKKIYGEGGYETLISNSGMIQYFGSRDRMTAEYFSALCGVTTVWNISTAIARAFGYSSGPNGGSSSNSTTTTETNSAMQRKLAFPDELMRLPAHRQLILIEHHDPIMGTKVRWFENPALKTLGRDLTKG